MLQKMKHIFIIVAKMSKFAPFNVIEIMLKMFLAHCTNYIYIIYFCGLCCDLHIFGFDRSVG